MVGLDRGFRFSRYKHIYAGTKRQTRRRDVTTQKENYENTKHDNQTDRNGDSYDYRDDHVDSLGYAYGGGGHRDH